MSADDGRDVASSVGDPGSDGRSRPSIRRVGVGLFILLVIVVGIGVLLGMFGTPGVENVENRFGGVNETSTTIETNVTVSNPNPIGVSFGGVSINYTVTMNEIAIAHGSKSGVRLETGNTSLAFTTLLANERIPDWWVSHIRNGERTTLRVDADVRSTILGRSATVTPVERDIDTDLLASFATDESQPVTTDAPVGNPVLVIEETAAAWGTVSEARTPIEMTLRVHNPNQYPVVISRIGYDATMNEIPVGEGATESGVTIPPGETVTVDARAVIANQQLDEWWVSHIERNQVSTLRIQYFVTLDLSAVGAGETRIPLRPMTTTIETDLFDNKPAPETATETPTETATDTGSTTQPTRASTTTAEDGSPVPTPTATPSPTSIPTTTDTPSEDEPTPTETETESDDGLPLP